MNVWDTTCVLSRNDIMMIEEEDLRVQEQNMIEHSRHSIKYMKHDGSVSNIPYTSHLTGHSPSSNSSSSSSFRKHFQITDTYDEMDVKMEEEESDHSHPSSIQSLSHSPYHNHTPTNHEDFKDMEMGH